MSIFICHSYVATSGVRCQDPHRTTTLRQLFEVPCMTSDPRRASSASTHTAPGHCKQPSLREAQAAQDSKRMLPHESCLLSFIVLVSGCLCAGFTINGTYNPDFMRAATRVAWLCDNNLRPRHCLSNDPACHLVSSVHVVTFL